MTPKRISAGYTKDGKKIYKRFFLIKKFKVIPKNLNEEINVTTEGFRNKFVYLYYNG